MRFQTRTAWTLPQEAASRHGWVLPRDAAPYLRTHPLLTFSRPTNQRAKPTSTHTHTQHEKGHHSSAPALPFPASLQDANVGLQKLRHATEPCEGTGMGSCFYRTVWSSTPPYPLSPPVLKKNTHLSHIRASYSGPLDQAFGEEGLMRERPQREMERHCEWLTTLGLPSCTFTREDFCRSPSQIPHLASS